MATQTYITTFKEEHLEQATAVITRSLISLNPIWKSQGVKEQDIYSVIRGIVIPSISYGWSEVLMRGDKVIGVSIQYDILDYLKMPSMPSELELFKKLGEAGSKLEAKMDFSELQRGDAVYGPYGVLDPTETGRGLSLEFWWYLIVQAKYGGWKYYYSRLSSAASLKVLCKLGAEVMAEVELDGEKLWMVRVDFSKTYPSYTMLKSIISAAQKNAKL